MNTILYCPLLDFDLLKEFINLGKCLDSNVEFEFQGVNPWHDAIKNFDFSKIPNNSDFFKQKSIVGTYADSQKLQEFLKENNFSLNPSMPKKNANSRIIECLALAFMELKTTWPEGYNAERHQYKIPSNFGDSIYNIDGFKLRHTKMKIKHFKHLEEYLAVSAGVILDNIFAMTFSDITAFAENVSEFEKLIQRPVDLYNQVVNLRSDYNYDGHLICPKVNECAQISNHLKDISLKAKYPNGEVGLIDRINLTASQQLSWLKLDEKGVEVRSEAYASGEMILTACAHGPSKPYFPLIIEHGLVFTIYCLDQPFFVGYIPQEKFTQK